MWFFLLLVAGAQTLTVPKTLYHRCTEGGDAGSCYELGDLYARTGQPGDVALGHQYIRYGCKLELKKKCEFAEADVRRGHHLKARRDWDAEQARLLAAMPTVRTNDELSCAKGEAKGCHLAAVHYFYIAKFRNPDKAKALYIEGCRLGEKQSCDALRLIEKGIVKVYDVDM